MRSRKTKITVVRDDSTWNKKAWPPRLARLLGAMPDPTVAARVGVSLKAVKNERQRRGIPAFMPRRPNIDWTDEMIALLGTASDAEVAADLGVAMKSVRYKRRVLGIPPFHEASSHPSNLFWTPKRVALLGAASDKGIAKRLGIPPGAVTYHRTSRGIPAFRPHPPKFVWTKARVRLLGTISDRRVARKFGISWQRVGSERRRRGIAPFRSSRKVIPTPELRRILPLRMYEVFERTGLSRPAVNRLREELGIVPPERVSPWTPEVLRDLGRVPDEEIAERLGLTLNTVRSKRLSLGRPTILRWTPEEDAIVLSTTNKDASARTGRTEGAVETRRSRLKSGKAK